MAIWPCDAKYGHFERTAEAEAQSLGPAMEDILVDSWRRAGYERVLELIRKANDGNDGEMCIRWVWFDTQSGNPDAPPRPPRNALRRLSCSSTARWSRCTPTA